MNRSQRRRLRHGSNATVAGGNTPAALAFAAAAVAAQRDALDEAERCYRRALALDPALIDARHDLGVVALRRGQIDTAIAAFEQVIAKDARHVGAWMNLGIARGARGDLPKASAAAARAAALRPDSSALQVDLGRALMAAADLEGALAAFRTALGLDPSGSAVRLDLAAVLRRMGQNEPALLHLTSYIAACPHDPAGYVERAAVLDDLGRLGDAAGDRRIAVRRAGPDPELLRARCAALGGQDRAEEAMALLDIALVERPAVQLYLERATQRQKRGLLDGALDDLKTAAELDQTDARTYFRIGLLLEQRRQHRPAAACFLHAIELQPDLVEAYVHLAIVRMAIMDTEGAAVLFRHAATLKPDVVQFGMDLCWVRLLGCDWHGLEDAFRENLAKALVQGVPFPPFTLLSLGLPISELLLWTRAWAEHRMTTATPPLTRYATPAGLPRPARIRVGYLSADFFNHATALLVTGLLEAHDRTRFETFGYNIGITDQSEIGRRMIGALDRFADLTAMDDAAAARRIAADGIDILIDLKGFTTDSRPGILGHRPAPIQVNYLGYPGSMGTRLIDYVIADPIVVPQAHQADYDEAIVHLPHAYQPNDRRRSGADKLARRQDHGLPECGFVFSCFNTNYKITPLVFDIWARLLSAVPGSVLWLVESNVASVANLRAAARERGIPSERLVFAPRVSVPAHLARLWLADLFLDTLPYGAHTTASEALWAGLPVLTCLGPHFSSRVAASLLTTIGLPELIAPDLASYERMALALARDPARLHALRTRLEENRLTSPLFDTQRYARTYQDALERMVDRRVRGLPPAPFAVEEQG